MMLTAAALIVTLQLWLLWMMRTPQVQDSEISRAAFQPVVIESPFAGNKHHTEAEHRAYLQAAIRDCIARGETPYASHQMLTDAFDDADADERRLGLNAGFAMADALGCKVAIYTDYSASDGMVLGIKAHRLAGRTIEFRKIDPGLK